jgi:hypothetical protein
MTFTDPHYPGFSIRVLNIEDNGVGGIQSKAMVEVIMPGGDPPPQPCQNIGSFPTRTIIGSNTVAPGGVLQYTVTIKNDDVGECTASEYTVTARSNLSGISSSPASRSWTLSPGQSGEPQVFSITIPENAPNGSYDMDFAATRPEISGSFVGRSTFHVLNTGITPPSVAISGVTNNELISPTNNTKITATASHAAGISRIEIFINDRLVGVCNNPRNNMCDMFVKGSNTVVGSHILRVVATANNAEQTTGTANMTFRR